MREILAISKGLDKRNGIGAGAKRTEVGGRKLFAVGGLLVRFPPPLFAPARFSVFWRSLHCGRQKCDNTSAITGECLTPLVLTPW